MRILFLTDNFPPEVNAPATRTYEHCIEWVKAGEEVTVITCFPNFPQGQVFAGYTNRFKRTEYIEGIKVIRVWSYISSNSGFLKRIIDFISYAFMAFWVGLFVKTDVIIGTSPQFFTAISARMLSFFKRKPWVMEVRDLWPESIAAVGALERNSITYKILEKTEHHLYRSARLIISVTESFKRYISPLVGAQGNIQVITNGVDATKFSPRSKDISLIKKLGLENKFIIGYIGTHGMAHALDFILSCAKKTKDDSVQFVLLGDGAEKKNLLERAQREHIQNVLFLPFVSKAEVKNYISILDAALVNLKKSDTFKSVIPSKIFENACMGKPILHGVEGESKEIIERYNAGIAFKPENIESFMQALERIQDKDTYNQLVSGCKELAQEYNRKKLANEMLKAIRSAVQNN